MVDRKRRNARPNLEPMEGRDLLSGLLVALQSNVPHLSASQVAAIATNLSRPSGSGHVSAEAATGASGGGGTGSSSGNTPAGTGDLSIGGGGSTSVGGLYGGGNNPLGINFPTAPIVGSGTPTAAELAREKFVAKFTGPMSIKPGRFSDQEQIIYLRGLGGSTPNFFLHGDDSLAIVIPTGFNPNQPGGTGTPTLAGGAPNPTYEPPLLPDGTTPNPAYVPPVTGFAFLDDKNNNSGGVVGLDLVADPTSFDAKGRPTRMTFTADPNVYGGIFLVDSAVGNLTITYGKNSATSSFNGRIYTSGLTSPFQNVDLYAKHSG